MIDLDFRQKDKIERALRKVMENVGDSGFTFWDVYQAHITKHGPVPGSEQDVINFNFEFLRWIDFLFKNKMGAFSKGLWAEVRGEENGPTIYFEVKGPIVERMKTLVAGVTAHREQERIKNARG